MSIPNPLASIHFLAFILPSRRKKRI